MPFYVFINNKTGRLKIFDRVSNKKTYWIDHNDKWRSSEEMGNLGYELIGEL